MDHLEDYKGLIETATSILNTRLETINKKLISLEKRAVSGSATIEIQDMNEERSRTENYLLICGQFSQVMNQLRPSSASTKDLPQSPDSTARRITSNGIEECRVSMAQTAARLENDMQDILDRMISSSSATAQEDTRYIAGLREDWMATRKCRDICLQADQQLKENIKVIDNPAENNGTMQFQVSNSQSTIFGKNRGYGDQSMTLGGYISDESIRKLSGEYLQMSVQKPTDGVSSTHLDTSSILDEARTVKVDSEAYNQLRTGSSNSVFPPEGSTDTGTRLADMSKSTTATAYRLLWTCVGRPLNLGTYIGR